MRYCEHLPDPAWSETLACTDALCSGTGRSLDIAIGPVGSDGPWREGEEPKPLMHDPEKSDSGIVAMKPMNKAGRPAAELAEPRPGTKGNADQQSTHRTQSRARVTQALDRVRKAARQRKKEQFTSLLHHMNVDLLRTAPTCSNAKPHLAWMA